MNELPKKIPAPERQPETNDDKLRSPIRPPTTAGSSPNPTAPKLGLIARAAQLPATNPAAPKSDAPADASHEPRLPQDPRAALEYLREKMEKVATEFGQGKINRAQFNAIYGRYSEQRTIVEKLIERNPDNQAWKQAAAPGHTSFLRDHFEARLLYYLVYQHNLPTPLMMGGKQQPDMDRVGQVLKTLWGMPTRPKVGLARKEMGNGQWLVLALGEFAITLALFQLEPSTAQANLVRDLHNDFERANLQALQRGTRSLDRFVFPQRALAEKAF